jgi:hypothetical protein
MDSLMAGFDNLAIANIRPKALIDLYNHAPVEPMDALNLIQITNHDFYALYGVLVIPLLKLIGSELIVTLELKEALHGEAKFNHCLIARYQSHRRFLGMISNPYYILINRAREAGVKYLELSFTESRAALPVQDLSLRNDESLVLLRLKSSADWLQIESAAAKHALEVAYHSEKVMDLDIFAEYKATNPNPLEYPVSVFLRATGKGKQLTALGQEFNSELEKQSLDYTLSLWEKTKFKEGFISGILSRLVEA